MTEKIVVFNDESGRIVLRKLTSENGDPMKAFRAACAKADADGVRKYNYEVPSKYLKAEGVKMTKIATNVVDIDVLGRNASPIRLCLCHDCECYDQGSCSRYGGRADGFQDGYSCDRLRGTMGKILMHDGCEVISCPFETDMTAEEVVAYLQKTKDENLKKMQEELMDYLLDYEEDDEEIKTGWSFGRDDGYR